MCERDISREQFSEAECLRLSNINNCTRGCELCQHYYAWDEFSFFITIQSIKLMLLVLLLLLLLLLTIVKSKYFHWLLLHNINYKNIIICEDGEDQD